MDLDMSKPTRTKEWKDSQGNIHLLETYVYGNGCFLCKKFVNGVEEKTHVRENTGCCMNKNSPYYGIHLLTQMRKEIRDVCLRKESNDNFHENILQICDYYNTV